MEEWCSRPYYNYAMFYQVSQHFGTKGLFALGGEKCPILTMETLISKHPDELKSCGPLYLTPLQDF